MLHCCSFKQRHESLIYQAFQTPVCVRGNSGTHPYVCCWQAVRVKGVLQWEETFVFGIIMFKSAWQLKHYKTPWQITVNLFASIFMHKHLKVKEVMLALAWLKIWHVCMKPCLLVIAKRFDYSLSQSRGHLVKVFNISCEVLIKDL